MPTKSKQECVIKNLSVQPRGCLTSDVCQNLVREVVKHLLYMRNQIPGLFEDLDWQVQVYERQRELRAEKARLAQLHVEADSVQHAELQPDVLKSIHSRKQRLPTSQKCILKFMQSANSLLDNISLELFTKQPTHLLLAFGPTASRPSEVYSLAFPAVGPTKMFLLVHGHFEENCIPDGFLFKRAFQIRMKKGMQVHMDLTGAVQDQTHGSAPKFIDPASGEQGLSWYQCKIVLKGLRSPGSNEVDRTG
ncbi:TPA: hypothetical protein ACH3X2_000142 [Trebouxia sp. C0005]